MAIKKSLGLGLLAGLLAMAFALPASAMASVTLESEGEALPKEAPVRGAGTNVVTHTSAGTLECSLVEINGEVGENGTEPATVENVNNNKAENCKAGEAPVVVLSITVGTVSFFANHTDEAPMEFVFDVFTGPETFIKCHLGGTVDTTWVTGSSTDTIAPSLLTGGGDPGCPAEGTIEGELSLSSNGAPVTVN